MPNTVNIQRAGKVNYYNIPLNELAGTRKSISKWYSPKNIILGTLYQILNKLLVKIVKYNICAKFKSTYPKNVEYTYTRKVGRARCSLFYTCLKLFLELSSCYFSIIFFFVITKALKILRFFYHLILKDYRKCSSWKEKNKKILLHAKNCKL